jgi:hypothetical protein
MKHEQNTDSNKALPPHRQADAAPLAPTSARET